MTPATRRLWADKIITFIVANSPTTLDVIEARAKEKDWYTWQDFDAILLLIKKDSRVTATVTSDGSNVIYKKRVARTTVSLADKRAETAKVLMESYPIDPYTGELSPFKVCSCALFHTHWQSDFGHFERCDAIVFSDEYRSQNPWDRTAGKALDQEAYDKEVRKREAIGKKTMESIKRRKQNKTNFMQPSFEWTYERQT